MGTVSKKCMGSKKGELECGVAEANMGHVRVPVYAGQGLKLLPGVVQERAPVTGFVNPR